MIISSAFELFDFFPVRTINKNLAITDEYVFDPSIMYSLELNGRALSSMYIRMIIGISLSSVSVFTMLDFIFAV